MVWFVIRYWGGLLCDIDELSYFGLVFFYGGFNIVELIYKDWGICGVFSCNLN